MPFENCPSLALIGADIDLQSQRKAIEDMIYWIDAYKSLEDYVRANEPTSCLTYYFGTPAEFRGDHSASPSMLAIEQYRVRSDLYGIHFHSTAMGPFLEKIPATMTTGLDRSHYEDVGGFLHRDGDGGWEEGQRGVWWDTKIWCKEGTAREEMVDQEEKGEDSIWSYLVLKCLDDDFGVWIFERYRDQEALERHWKGQGLLEFWKGSKELVRSMEGRGYVPSGWGWLHR